MTPTIALLAAALAAGAPPAAAQDIDYAQSRIAFTFRQMNVPVEGAFRRFTAQLRFDAERPERSRAEIEVDLASIDTGAPEGDTEAQRRPWFDAANHPRAKFVSSGVRRLGPERYEIAGTLSIKGRARELAIPVDIRRGGATLTFEGAFALKRLEYAIGEGVWADTDTVADEVQVRFRVVQRTAAPKK
jgi:polyisoprenoid-binding protein YceI